MCVCVIVFAFVYVCVCSRAHVKMCIIVSRERAEESWYTEREGEEIGTVENHFCCRF